MNLNNLTITLGGSPRIRIGGQNLTPNTTVAGVLVRKLHSLREPSEK